MKTFCWQSSVGVQLLGKSVWGLLGMEARPLEKYGGSGAIGRYKNPAAGARPL